MQQLLKSIIPFIKRIGFVLVLYTLCRILFLVFNYSLLGESISFLSFVGGIRFDLSSVALLFAPFTFLWFAPFFNKKNSFFLFTVNSFYFGGVLLSIFLNLLDIIYFRFTLKRTTADVLTVMSNTNDLVSLIPRFALDYWYVVLLFLLLIGILLWFIKKNKIEGMFQLDFYPSIFALFVALSLSLLAFRGGWQYKPITIVNAAAYSSPQQVPLVLNTPFTFFKTLTEPRIKPEKYFTEEELKKYFNADIEIKSQADFSGKNVVLIILESFSKEYIGYYNKGKGYTPFLDSLLKNSIVYTNCFANGKQSIEGIPAIIASLPTLMDDSYITSPYAGNKINSLASILNQQGYTSHFYHGGHNGTMSFDAFAKAAGYNYYYGKNEYPNKNDEDGHWGIFDEPYLQYVAEELEKKQNPFLATVFTLSSHHPFRVPEKYKGTFPKGEYEIHESIGYADYALKHFFETAEKAEWYKNTVFILTADHTSISKHPYYKNSLGNYAIPFAIFEPSILRHAEIHTVCQQTDILPTLLQYLHYKGMITSFGNIADSASVYNFCVNYSSGIFQFINDSCLLQFDGKKSIALYHYQTDSLLSENKLTEEESRVQEMENKLKAIIQTYQQRLIKNQLTPR
ncbi:MAG: sulfatase-like hydrolase/transferase [Bacteroidetes bacterium]|nr:hypothetical protein [Bacteroidota bacterium]MBV6460085.1 Phosphoglycerol transferase I [Flavobacteriales bacterium]WKZ73958.1 MAG: sulfatase-like hydrolase/transferase [Vicingaceae bacterium]MCL4816436.1 LTA synthase family protein [Flavobacteriales bacterium]NOG95510.1 sulfatase-like hydrolase/transferase [Bacteroidota bacterium]